MIDVKIQDIIQQADNSLVNDLINEAKDKGYVIGTIKYKREVYYENMDIRMLCQLALEIFFDTYVQLKFIIDTSNLIDKKEILVAFTM